VRIGFYVGSATLRLRYRLFSIAQRTLARLGCSAPVNTAASYPVLLELALDRRFLNFNQSRERPET
jgi:hypothetical protein